MALEHSGHKLKAKGVMAMLTDGDLSRKDGQSYYAPSSSARPSPP